MDPNNLPGPLKVAILVKSVGEDAAKKILAAMNDSERELIRKHMFQLGEVAPDLVEKVAKDFTEKAEQRKALQLNEEAGPGGEGEAESDGFDSGTLNLSAIKSMEPDSLTKMIKDEYPQTIAIILANVEPDVASEVLSRLPDEIKPDVAIRIAKLNKVVSGMIEEIDITFSNILSEKDSSKTEEAGGVSRLADILNQIDSDSSDLIVNDMEERDPELAAQTKQGMFVFEDLVINALEEFANIAFEHIPIAIRITPAAFTCGQCAFAFLTGVRIMNEPALDQRAYHVAQRVVHHTVPVRGTAEEDSQEPPPGRSKVVFPNATRGRTGKNVSMELGRTGTAAPSRYAAVSTIRFSNHFARPYPKKEVYDEREIRPLDVDHVRPAGRHCRFSMTCSYPPRRVYLETIPVCVPAFC